MAPLAVTIPAAIAAAAWLNAKTQLTYDLSLIHTVLTAPFKSERDEKNDRINLFYTLEQHATSKANANAPFLLFEQQQWTFKETYHLTLKYAAWLKSNHAIAPGEVVAIDFTNCPQYVALWFAIWSLGAFPAFINYNLSGQALIHSIKTSTSRLVLVDEKTKANFSQDVMDALASPDFADGKGPSHVVFYNPALEEEIVAMQGYREPDSSRSGPMGHDVSLLIYTSGTTGLPKAANVSWNKCHISGKFAAIWLNIKRTDRFYTCMPLYHSSAALMGLCSALVNGHAIIIGRKFSTTTFWHDVRTHNANVIQYVGETCRYLLAAPPQIDLSTGENLDQKHNVRIAFGNGLRPDVWERFKKRFGIDTIAEFFAATESPNLILNKSSNDFSRGAVCRGGPLASLALARRFALVKLDWESESPYRSAQNRNFCVPAMTNEPAELLVKLDAKDIARTFQGYYKNEKASSWKVLRDVFVKGDAWFRTGDLVRRDENGMWWFCDRVGDTFRWKSENVSTAEVSEALGGHPSVQEANVYGVEIPNHDGRAGCAAVCLAREINQGLLDELASHAKSNLPKYAVPLFLRVTKDMPSTGNNKQQKHILRTEGVQPSKVRNSGADRLFWLHEGTYVEFQDKDWDMIQSARAKL